MPHIVRPVAGKWSAVSGWQAPAGMASKGPASRQAKPQWMRMTSGPMMVREARRYAAEVLAQAGIGDQGLVEDVRLVVSELVTNAMRAAERLAVTRGASWASYERPVALRVECRPRWVHLFVVDPDPQMTKPTTRDVLDEGGRGITIVESVGALHWYVPGTYGKTVHAVVTRSGAKLTDREIDQLRQRMIL